MNIYKNPVIAKMNGTPYSHDIRYAGSIKSETGGGYVVKANGGPVAIMQNRHDRICRRTTSLGNVHRIFAAATRRGGGAYA
jgi:hypothetical protein